jgi:polyphenol oxidase
MISAPSPTGSTQPMPGSYEMFSGFPADLTAGITLRRGGTSAGTCSSFNLGLHTGDDAKDVVANRLRLASSIDAKAEDFVFADQVHGSQIATVKIGQGFWSHDDAVRGTDALITSERGLVLVIMVADCAPVIVFDPVRSVLALVHVGWRGAVGHLTSAVISRMEIEFGCKSSDLLVGVGPCIGFASFEVGPDVVALSDPALRSAATASVGDSYRFDIQRAIDVDLKSCGVRLESVEVMAGDTYLDTDDYFSYRRDGSTGRHACYARMDGLNQPLLAPW